MRILVSSPNPCYTVTAFFYILYCRECETVERANPVAGKGDSGNIQKINIFFYIHKHVKDTSSIYNWNAWSIFSVFVQTNKDNIDFTQSNNWIVEKWAASKWIMANFSVSISNWIGTGTFSVKLEFCFLQIPSEVLKS